MEDITVLLQKAPHIQNISQIFNENTFHRVKTHSDSGSIKLLQRTNQTRSMLSKNLDSILRDGRTDN